MRCWRPRENGGPDLCDVALLLHVDLNERDLAGLQNLRGLFVLYSQCVIGSASPMLSVLTVTHLPGRVLLSLRSPSSPLT